MAKEKKVEQITDMEVDFAQWFTDVCTKAQLIDYSSIKGVFIYRPYGYAIWENIQNIMDKEFKKQGVENVYMPLLIPESLLQKEKDHVEGFAPECAWVTMGGGLFRADRFIKQAHRYVDSLGYKLIESLPCIILFNGQLVHTDAPL